VTSPASDHFARLLETRAPSARQFGILALVMLALIIDGLDIQLLALVSPLILAQWGIDKASFGPALSAALIGMALGASIGGLLGDRFGRKRLLIAAMLSFGLATAAASLSEAVWQMALLRIVSGFGFGAAAPNAIALCSEWLPGRYRAMASALLSIGTPLGGMLGATTVLSLAPIYGWQGCFIACGLLTILLALLMLVALPESPSFLVRIGRAAQAHRLFERFVSRKEILAQPAATRVEPQPEQGAARLFARENRRFNLGVWLAFFSIQFVAYTFAAWTPVLLTMVSIPLAQAVQATVAFNFCAVAAAITAAAAVNRLGPRRLMLLTSIGTLLAVLLMAFGVISHQHSPADSTHFLIIMIASGMVGGLTGACIAAVYVLLASAYAVACRASGIGFALMVGRAGGIATTMVGGALLELAGDSIAPFFVVLTVIAVCAIIGTSIIDRDVAPVRR
jgi:AAHS family 4-hydroxybenzoate transporter-like MFS transporter